MEKPKESSDYVGELNSIENQISDIDNKICELDNKKKQLMNDFLAKLPFQPGDIVETSTGKKIIIEKLERAAIYGNIYVSFYLRKIKKNGEPYAVIQNSCGINYWDLKKVDK